LFLDSSEHIDLKQNVFGDPGSVSGAWCGVVLLLLFLFFDSFTGQWQTRLFQINKSLSPLQMMLIMNAFSAVFSFITLIHQEEFMESLTFVYKHPEMILHLVIFCICSTVGQLFIFYTGNTAIQLTVLRLDQKLAVLLHSFYFFLIWNLLLNPIFIVKNFGAVVFSIIMSTRILFSTLLSCFVYSHPITELGFLGMAIVFGAITYRIKHQTAGKQLIRWRENEEAKVVFNEWHEHLDI
jgi:adenosine 3'-phospho 5'-phosphosulfate transporter B2